MRVKGSPCGTEFELKINAVLVNTCPVDRTQARPVPVMPFRVRHKDLCSSGRRQDAWDAEP